MIVKDIRRRVRVVRARLEELPELPRELRAFHRARARALEDVEQLEGSWLPWGHKEPLRELEEQAQTLATLATVLGPLVERRRELDGLLSDLEIEAESGAGDPEIDRWMEERLESWRAQLAGFGYHIRRARDAEVETRRLEELHSEMVRARDARRLLIQAGLDPSQSGPAVFKRRLLDHGPDRRWFRELRATLETLRAEQGVRSPDHADHMRRIDAALPRLWEWARVSSEHGPSEHSRAVTELARRREGLGSGPSGDGEPGVLAEQVETLLAEIEADAQEKRDQRRNRLQGRIAGLSLLKVHADLEESFQELVSRSVIGPRKHRDWTEACVRLENLFRDRLQNEHQRVEAAFRRSLEEVGERLEQARHRPMARKTLAAVEKLVTETRDLRVARGVDGQFEAIERLRAIGREVLALVERADQELRRLHDLSASLDHRRGRLKKLASRLDGFEPAPEPPGLEPPATKESPAESPEETTRRLAARGAHWTAEEERFVATCEAQRRSVAELNRELATVLDIAVELELSAEPIPPTGVGKERADPSSPEQAVAAWEAEMRYRKTLEKTFRHVCQGAKSGVTSAVEQLTAIDAERLRPGEKRVLMSCLTEVDAEILPLIGALGNAVGESAGTPDRAQRQALGRILVWLREQEELVRRTEGRRRRLVERRDRLIERLHELEALGGSAACPDIWVERAHALVHGLEASSLEEADADQQLMSAELLLERLEDHGGRRLAHEMSQAMTLLGRSTSSSARGLWAEVQALGDESPPSASLRRRVQQVLAMEEA